MLPLPKIMAIIQLKSVWLEAVYMRRDSPVYWPGLRHEGYSSLTKEDFQLSEKTNLQLT